MSDGDEIPPGQCGRLCLDVVVVAAPLHEAVDDVVVGWGDGGPIGVARRSRF